MNITKHFKKHAGNVLRASLCVALLAGAVGCKRDLSSRAYTAGDLGTYQVYNGTVLKVERAKYEENSALGQNTTGGALGGLGGALIGQFIGKGSGRIAAAGLGALLGAFAGAYGQRFLEGQEILVVTVKLDNGNVVKVPQAPDRGFSTGARVQVEVPDGGGRPRVVPL